MTALDWIIAAFVALLAWWGFTRGAVLGASSLLGLAAGAVIGGRLAGALLSEGSRSPYAPLFALGGALIAGAIVSELALALGFRLRVRFTSRTARRFDGALGALLLGALACGLVWIGAAAVTQSRVALELRASVRRSVVIRHLNELLPPTGPVLNALARIDPFPRISGPAANVPAPDGSIVGDPEVVAAAPSVVRVRGTACGFGVEGSGWIAAPDVVVTNAHVVAGQTDTTIQVAGDGPEIEADAILFDSRNDLALLVAPLGGAPSLATAGTPPRRTRAAVLGFPLDGPFDARPARVASTQTVISRDAYGRGPVTRAMTSFRGLVRHGNSGGPLVDSGGRVVGTVFAAAEDDGRRGYAVPNEIVDAALRRADAARPVGTGPCA